MNNISSIKNCFGCGVCAIACPKKIIDLRLNPKIRKQSQWQSQLQ